MSPPRDDDDLSDLEAQLVELAQVLEEAEDAIAEAARQEREGGRAPSRAAAPSPPPAEGWQAEVALDEGASPPPLDVRVGGFAASIVPEAVGAVSLPPDSAGAISPPPEAGSHPPRVAPGRREASRDDPARRVVRAPALPEPVGARQVVARYGSVVAALEAVTDELGGGSSAALPRLHRAVGSFLATAARRRSTALALVAAGPYRERVEGQLALVGLLSALMAARLGLAGALLREIAVAASLAGVGRALDSSSAAGGPTSWGEAGLYLDGVRRLLPGSGRGRAAALRIVLAAELSRPELRVNGNPLTLLVAAAEEYEWRSRPAEASGLGLRPDLAIEELRGEESLSRKARLALLATLGIYPVGTSVRLTTDEVAVVVGPPRRPDRLAAPPVMVVADALGHPADGRVVDLAAAEVAIARVVTRTEADLGVGQFMFT